MPLQQIDMLSDKETRAYLVGTTNQLFFHQKTEINIDVLVHVNYFILTHAVRDYAEQPDNLL